MLVTSKSTNRWLVVVMFWQADIIWTRLGTASLKSGRVRARGFLTVFWVWRFILLSRPCIAHLFSLPDRWEEEGYQVVPPGRSGYSGVCYSRRTRVPASRRMWLEGLSQSMLRNPRHPFELLPERRGSVCVRGELCRGQKASNRFRQESSGKGCMPNKRTNKHDISDKG